MMMLHKGRSYRVRLAHFAHSLAHFLVTGTYVRTYVRVKQSTKENKSIFTQMKNKLRPAQWSTGFHFQRDAS